MSQLTRLQSPATALVLLGCIGCHIQLPRTHDALRTPPHLCSDAIHSLTLDETISPTWFHVQVSFKTGSGYSRPRPPLHATPRKLLSSKPDQDVACQSDGYVHSQRLFSSLCDAHTLDEMISEGRGGDRLSLELQQASVARKEFADTQEYEPYKQKGMDMAVVENEDELSDVPSAAKCFAGPREPGPKCDGRCQEKG